MSESLSTQSAHSPVPLTVQNVPEYLLAHQLISEHTPLQVRELGGGIANTVLQYKTADSCAVLKQAQERMRVAEEWLCDPRRVYNECDSMRILGQLLPPGSVPHIYFEDKENFVFVMSCVPEDAYLWKTHLLAGDIDSVAATRAGKLLQLLHRSTWQNAQLRERFTNESILRQVRLDPYYFTTAQRNPAVAAIIHAAAETIRTTRLTLVHTDYAPKNIFIIRDGICVLDFENVHYGHPAYDAATCINHLLLKGWAFSRYRAQFVEAALHFWQAYADDHEPALLQRVEEEIIRQLGCLMLARIDGKSPVEYIKDDTLRQRVRECAYQLLQGNNTSIEGVITSAYAQ